MNLWLRLSTLCVFLSNCYVLIHSFTRPRQPLREARGDAAQSRPSSLHVRRDHASDDVKDVATPWGDPLLPHRGWNSRSSQYLATCIPGLSTVMAQELAELKCHDVVPTSKSGVTFRADLPTALRVLLRTRTAHKVLELLCEGDSILDRDSLMSFVRDSVNVKDLLGDGRGGLLSLSVQVVMTGGKSGALSSGRAPTDLTHSKFTALSIKNALCDAVRELRGDRPDVDVDNPDVPLVAFVRGTSVSLYRQLHVGSLHRRGYRSGSAIHKAAMKESLAAGLLLRAGWDEQVREHREEWCRGNENSRLVLADPMAGSGTLLIEAALAAADVAPGLLRLARDRIDGEVVMPGQRLPPVLRWKHQTDSDGTTASDIWKAQLVDASEEAKRGVAWLRSSRSILFLANDCHPGALDLLEESLAGVDKVVPGLSSHFEIHQKDCGDWVPGQMSAAENAEIGAERRRVMVVCNPPWGERLSEDMHISWESLRTFLRETCPPNTEAWVLSGNAAATKHLGLKRSAAIPLQTGQQDLRWIQYVIRNKSAQKDSPGPWVGDAAEERTAKLTRRSTGDEGDRSSANDRSRTPDETSGAERTGTRRRNEYVDSSKLEALKMDPLERHLPPSSSSTSLKSTRQPKKKLNAATMPSKVENEWLL